MNTEGRGESRVLLKAEAGQMHGGMDTQRIRAHKGLLLRSNCVHMYNKIISY